MRRLGQGAGGLAGALALALSAAAFAQPAAPIAGPAARAQVEARYLGRTVRDSGGAALGEVAQVVLDSKGRPAQVLVQPRGKLAAGLKSLPIGALRWDGETLRTPLTKGEFEAMPAVEPVRN